MRILEKQNLLKCLIAGIFFLSYMPLSYGDNTSGAGVKLFQTGYCDIYYTKDSALEDFLWRISGKRYDFNFEEDKVVARLRVDRLVYRVESILDMFPQDFFVRVKLEPKYISGFIAFYDYNKHQITVYADKITDGIFAHEIGHAIISSYFDVPPPEKLQEILSQYIDKYLWQDY